MPLQIAIVEKTVGQPMREAYTLHLVSERISAKDIASAHVRAEIERLNDETRRNREKHDRVASFLVGTHSHATERRLNPIRKAYKKLLDPETEIETALQGIVDRHVIMLFDDREVEDLDTILTVTQDSTVTFLRLVPLVGG